MAERHRAPLAWNMTKEGTQEIESRVSSWGASLSAPVERAQGEYLSYKLEEHPHAGGRERDKGEMCPPPLSKHEGALIERSAPTPASVGPGDDWGSLDSARASLGKSG